MHPEFPHDEGLIYLNHAGVAPWPRRSGETARRFAELNVTRGAADYPQWLHAEQRLRERLARLIGISAADDIALVKNTSEGLSLVAYGLDWRRGDNVVINDQEFPSNRMVWQSLAERYGVEIRDVRLAAAATPEDALIEAMDERTRVLPVSAVQYASGLRMDLQRLGTACRDLGTLFCVDAIQQTGALRFDAAAIGADMVIADGHKWMLGPEGIGLFYVRPEVREQLRLHQYGWHMAQALGDFDAEHWAPARAARRFEPGSPNTLGVHVLEASLSLLEEIGMAAVEQRVQENTRHLLARIEAEKRMQAVTDVDPARHAGIVTVRIPGTDPQELLQALRRDGILCASRAGGIRFSPHFYQQPEVLDRAVERLLTVAQA